MPNCDGGSGRWGSEGEGWGVGGLIPFLVSPGWRPQPAEPAPHPRDPTPRPRAVTSAGAAMTTHTHMQSVSRHTYTYSGPGWGVSDQQINSQN